VNKPKHSGPAATDTLGAPHAPTAKVASSGWSHERTELLLLALTLLATVVISALTLRQTMKHFEIERTSAFVARFNSREMVELREDCDRWLETGESPAKLYDDSLAIAAGTAIEELDPKDPAARAFRMVSKLRTMANYFQEFGTALKIDSLDEHYAHELLGAVCIRYATSLKPFILESRIRKQRPQVYEEVFSLKARMELLDQEGKS
jgi:hypothetical protein